MVDRLLISLMILVGIGLLWPGWRYYKQWAARRIRPVAEAAGRPTLLYFSGEYCAVCKLRQTPVVAELVARWGAEIAIHHYDVAQHPDLARHYKILSLPATVVLDRQGQVAHLNYGFTSLPQLEEQLHPGDEAHRSAGLALPVGLAPAQSRKGDALGK